MNCRKLLRSFLLTICLLVAAASCVPAFAATEDSLRTALSTANDSDRPTLLRELSLLVILHDSAEAYQLLDEAQEHAHQLSNHEELCKIYVTYGLHAMHHGANKVAEPWMRKARDYQQQHQLTDPVLLCTLYGNIGQYLERIGELDSAITVGRKGLEIAKAHGLRKREAKFYLDLGIRNEHAGQLTVALGLADSVRLIAESLKDTSLLASAYVHMGNVSGQSGNTQQALEHFTQAVVFLKVSGSSNAKFAGVYNNMSISYTDLERYDMATTYVLKTIAMDSADNFVPGLVGDYINLGNIYLRTKKFVKAEAATLRALDMAIANGMTQDAALAWSNLAFVYLRQGKYDEGHRAAAKAAEANNNASLIRSKEIASVRYQLSEAEGDYRNAFSNLLEFKALYDSLFSKETQEAHDGLAAELETEKKQQKIERLEADRVLRDARLAKSQTERYLLLGGLAVTILLLLAGGFLLLQRTRANRLLRSKNAEISAQAATLAEQRIQIEATLAEREILLKEVHHRVKNNLQVISSLLDLQSNTLRDPAALRALQNGQNRILSMALIHKNLYQSDNVAEVRVDEYAKHLVAELATSMQQQDKPVHVDLQIPELSLNIDSALPIGLMLNELVTNSFKYAFEAEPNPKISISLSRQPDNTLKLVYSDNGCGLPEGFQMSQSTSLGLRLIKILTRQLKGTMEIHPPATFEMVLSKV